MLPREFLVRMRRLLGAEFDEFIAAYERPRSTALRFAPERHCPALPDFCGEIVPWEENGRYLLPDVRPGLHPLHDAGAFYLQEPSAMAPARLLDAQPGEHVLDLCAAPGGKSTQLAAAMCGRGLLVCNEIHPKRARILSSNLERLGVTNALVTNEHPAVLAARWPGCFDRVLVDAPCSGEGMFRKEEAAVTDWSEQTVAMCAARQAEILDAAAGLLASGGRLVYSTCTFSPEENEGAVLAFLRRHPEFSPEAVDAPYFSPARPEWAGGDALPGAFRLWPHKLQGEGHFAAVLRKNDGIRGSFPPHRLLPLPKEARDFLPKSTDGVLAFGEMLCLAPPDCPELHGLRVLRAGLELGELRKGRFVPAYALSHALQDFAQSIALDPRETAVYLSGATLPAAQRGWTLVKTQGVGLGWGYGADGTLKNHYPKGLRRILPTF